MPSASTLNYYRGLENNPALMAHLTASPDADSFIERSMQIGAEQGLEIDETEVRALAAHIQGQQPSVDGAVELSDDQLEAVDAGFIGSFGDIFGFFSNVANGNFDAAGKQIEQTVHSVVDPIGQGLEDLFGPK